MKQPLFLLVLCAGWLATPLSAQGDGLISELPAETVVYLELPDIQGIVNGSDNSTLGRIYAEPDVQEFLSGAMPMLRQGWDHVRKFAAAEGVPEELLQWSSLQSLEAGLCFVPSGGKPALCVGVSLGLSGDLSSQVFGMLSELAVSEGKGELKEDGRGKVLVAKQYDSESLEVWRRGDRILAVMKYGSVPATKLADNKRFLASRDRARSGNSLFYGFVDCAAGMDGLLEMMRLNAPREAYGMVQTLFASMGLNSLGSMSLASGWKSDGSSYMVFDMEPRGGAWKGVFAMEPKPVDLSLLDYIPERATSFSVSHVDGSDTWDLVRDSLREAMPPEALEQWQTHEPTSYDWVLGDRSKVVSKGFAGFGSRSFSYGVSAGMGGGGEGGSFSEVTDVAAVRGMLSEVMPLLQGFLEGNSEIPVGMDIKKLQIRERNDAGEIVTREGPEYYALKIRGDRLPREAAQAMMVLAGFQPTVGVTDDGWLVMNFTSGSPVRKALRSGVKKADTSIRENEDVADFLDRIPESAVQITWSDPRPGLQQAIQGAQAMLPMVAANVPPDFPVDLMAMPGPDVVVKHFRPSESFTYRTDTGRWVSQSTGSVSLVDAFVIAGALVEVGLPLVGMMRAEQAGQGSESAPEIVIVEEAPGVAIGGPESGEKRSEARKELLRLRTGVVVFKAERDRLPESLEEVTRPFGPYGRGFLPDPEKGIPKDPWGNAYVYEKQSDGYELYSKGPNGRAEGGSGDDVTAGGD